MPRTGNKRAPAIGLAGALLATGALAQVEDLPYGVPYPEQLFPQDRPPFPEGFAITRSLPGGGRSTARSSPDPAAIDLPRDLPDTLSACWTPPAVPDGQVWQVTVRLSFRADGAVIGVPATPYLQASDADAKRALRASLLAAIRVCTPLRFTPSLGRAIAGRIFAIRFLVHHARHDQRV